MVTQEGCLLGLQHPLSLFQAALPPLLSAMLPSAATTSPTSPSAGGDPPSELPAGADPPSEKKRNKQSTRSVSDTLQWRSQVVQIVQVGQFASHHGAWGDMPSPCQP